MKSIIASVLVVLAVVALSTADEPAPVYCEGVVCPTPLPEDRQVLLPSPKQCELYCHCTEDGPVEKSCPELNAEGDRLYFNANLQVCDWPESSGCVNP